jgi:hypothetical protein
MAVPEFLSALRPPALLPTWAKELDNYDVVKKHLFIHVGFGQFLGLSFFAS